MSFGKDIFPDEITQNDDLDEEKRKQVKKWLEQGYKEVRQVIEKPTRLLIIKPYQNENTQT